MAISASAESIFPAHCVLCVGIYGSASTWIYNACRLLMNHAFGEANVAAFYADAPLSGLADDRTAQKYPIPDRCCAAVIKLHEGCPETAELIATDRVQTLVTVRDPRDAIASVMRRFHWEFEEALEHVRSSVGFVDQILRPDRMLVLRYEDLFTRERRTVDRLAAYLNIAAEPGISAAIFSQLAPQAIDWATRAYDPSDAAIRVNPAGRLYDTQTHWHQRHIGDGSIGKWRAALSVGERNKIRTLCWKEITRLGYAGFGW